MPLATLAACVLAAGFVLGVVSRLRGPVDPALALPPSLVYDVRDPPSLPLSQDVLAAGAAAAVALLALTLVIGRWWVRRRLPPLAKVRPQQCRISRSACVMKARSAIKV